MDNKFVQIFVTKGKKHVFVGRNHLTLSQFIFVFDAE